MLNEVAPPGFGHTKGDKKKGVEKGGTAAAFDRARKEGRFKGSKSDMFAIMWSQKNKGDKPHYKPGTNKKYKKYQEEQTSMKDNNLFGDAYAGSYEKLKKKIGSKKMHTKPAIEENKFVDAMVSAVKKRKEEKKPEKAMDAGAKARRMLKRREHAKYVSGSEDNVPDEMREGVGSAVKAVGKAAGKAVGFAAKSAAGVVGHGVNALNQPGYKPKPKTGSTGNKSAGLSAAQSQAEKANKARLDARKKAIVKIKDDRRERATNIMTAEKAAKKVKKEGEDKKFKADSEKPIVAELHDIVKSRKKKAKCSK